MLRRWSSRSRSGPAFFRQAKAPGATNERRAGKRVLVLEDDYYLATDEKALLEKAGATVVGPFGNGFSASDLAEAEAFDAAVIDINMGSGPSFDWAQALLDRGVPFVFLTGYDAEIVPTQFSDVTIVEKPIRERDFIAAVGALLGNEDRTARGQL